MSDYQAIYDAVRSRISNGDVGEAVARAFQSMSLECAFQQAVQNALLSLEDAGREMQRPCVVFEARLSTNPLNDAASRWIAYFGDGPSSSVSGIGPSPEEAMKAFDVEWRRKA